MNTRVILLANSLRPAAVELRLDAGGRIVDRRLLPAGPTGTEPAARPRTTVVVPGQEVRVLWLELPAGSPLQVLAAARRALEDRVAAAADSIHVAVGEGAADAPRPVAVVDRQRMRDWLEACAALDVAPDALVPDCLMLPEPADAGIEALAWQDTWVVRGPHLAFTTEPALATAVLGAREVALRSDPAQVEARLASTCAQPALDLLQFEFAARPPAASRRRRRLAILAILALCMPLLALAAEALRHAWAAHSARARIAQLAQEHGIAGSDADAVAARFGQMTASDRFAAHSAALFAALAEQPDARLRSLAFDVSGGTDVQLRMADSGSVERLHARLVEDGLQVQVLDQAPDGSAVNVRLLLESSR